MVWKRSLYQRCAQIPRGARDAFDELAESAEEPAGTLRLSAPLDFGIGAAVTAIAAFTRRHSKYRVDVVFSHPSSDLMASQVELAIRVGWLTERHLQTRQIGSLRQLLVAPAAWRAPLTPLVDPAEAQAFVAHTALPDHAR